ncbi:MAG: SpoIIE family protein phosphatase [bacterium]|nr:SpoIIE family protein phosphatase [bacterium]
MSLELAKIILYFLSGGFLVFLAITITRDNFGYRLNRMTGAMLACAGLGPLFMALGAIAEQGLAPGMRLDQISFYNIHYIWELFFPCLLVFSWIYPIDRFRSFKHPRMAYLVFIPQITHVIIILFFPEFTKLLSIIEIDPTQEGVAAIVLKPIARLFSWILLLASYVRTNHEVIFGAFNLIYVFSAIFFLETGRPLVTSPRLKKQTEVVLWGTRFGLGLFVIAQLGATVLPYELPAGLTSVLILVAMLTGAGFFIFATIRHQFLDVRLVFRQSFVYTITSAILVGTYIVMVLQSRRFLDPIFGEQAELVSYVFIVFILLLFQPINNWIDNIIRALFMRTRTDPRNVMGRFSRQLISQFDPGQLRKIISEILKTSLLVGQVYFVLFDDEVEEYALLPGEDVPHREVIGRDDLMLRAINLLDRPTDMSTLSDYMENSKLGALLEKNKVRLVLPMKDSQHLLGFLALTDKITGYRYSSEDLNLLGVLSNQMVSALTNARLYVESLERIRLQEEVTMARQIQLDLLPSAPPILSCTEIHAQSTPSRTIGGDFYDFIDLGDDRVGVVIADASGKGMPAALMIAQTQAMIRSELHNGNSISTMLANVNQQIVQATSSEKYVTLFYGELNTRTHEFSYANAGHNCPLLVRSCGDVEFLQKGGPIIGALPGMQYEESTVKLETDDLLFLFTDGLSEAMNEREEEYTEERICEFIVSHRDHDPESILRSIVEDVRTHDPSTPPQDDTTIIALKMNNGLEPHV